LPPACPAQSGVIGIAGRLPVRSPTPSFDCAGSLLSGPPAGQFRSGPAGGNGLSLARDDCLFPGYRCEVKVPGLPLPCRASLSRKPFGLSAPPPATVCTRCGRAHCSEPVLPFQTCASGRYPDLHSPSGFFVPSGSKRSTGLQPESPPSVHARWPFAPRSPSINSWYCGSSFQTRYAPGGSLFPVPIHRLQPRLLTMPDYCYFDRLRH
jgi:hypothetical protein